MTLVRSAHAPCALVVVLAVALAGCAGGREGAARSEGEQARPEIETPSRTPVPGPPDLPRPSVVVLDGDTSKPVPGALVKVDGRQLQAGPDGRVELDVARGRAKVEVEARKYEPRALRLSFRGRIAHTVLLWRPDLQWPMYGVNPARTQAQAGIRLRPPFRRVWSRELRGLLEFPAIVWDGVAYVNNFRGSLRALSMNDGSLLWKKRVGRRMASSPAIDPTRRVLVTTSKSPGDVRILDLDKGRTLFRLQAGEAEPSPVIRNGLAYFASANGNVYALDLDRRRLRWVFHGGAKITGSPALAENRLFIGDYAGRVFALNAHSGRHIWTSSAGTHVYGTPAVAGGRVFVPSVSSGLSALSTGSGRLLWRIPVGAYLYSSPAVFRGRVYFGTYASRVYSVDARTGRILWTRPAGGPVSGAVEVVGGVVYAASFGNRTTAWHWRSGRTLWTFPHGRYVPVSGNGARLLLHGPSQIWAVRPKRAR